MARQSLKGLGDNVTVSDPYSIADKVTELNPAPRAIPDLTPAPGLELNGHGATVAGVLDELKNGYVEPEVFDDPTFGQLLGAAFRTENIVGSAIANLDVMRAGGVDSPVLSAEAAVQRAYADGLDQYAGILATSKTVAEYEANKAAVIREAEDRRLLQAAGFVGSFVPIAAAALFDVTTAIPGVAVVKGGSTVLNTAKAVAGAAVADATITEAALQATQRLRTPMESASNIAMSAVLGGVIGAGVGGMAGRFGNAVTNKIDARSAVANSPEGFAKMRGVGAAATKEWDALQAQTALTQDKLNTIEFKTLDWVDQNMDWAGWVGDKIRNPRRSLENGLSPAEREFANQIAGNPRLSAMEAQGVAEFEGHSFQSAHNEIQGYALDFVHDAEKAWAQSKTAFAGNKEEFGKQVALAIVRDEPHPDPIIESLAKNARDKVFNRIKDQLIANGTFVDDLQVKNADHYLPIIYDSLSIQARKDDFIAAEAAEYAAELRNEMADARTFNETRAKGIEAENQKVAREKAEIEAETKANVETISANREKELAEFEERRVLDLDQLRAERDDKIFELQRTKDELIDALDDAEDIRAAQESDKARIKEETERLRTERDEKLVAIRDKRDQASDKKAARKTAKAEIEAARTEYKETLAKLKDQVSTERSEMAATTKSERAKIERQTKSAIEKTERDAIRQEAKLVARQKKEKGKLQATYQKQLDTARTAAKEAKEASRAARVNATAKKDVKLRTEGDIKAEATRLAEELYASVTGQRRFTLDHEVGAALANYRKKRTNPARHERLIEMGFVKTDILDIVEHYTRTAGTDAAAGRVFKKEIETVDPETGEKVTKMVGDHNFSKVLKDIEADYKVLIDNPTLSRSDQRKVNKAPKDKQDALRNELLAKTERSLLNKRDRAIRNVEVLRSLIRGGSIDGSDGSNWNELAEVLGLFNYMRLMGGVVLSSLGDPINIMLANGFGRTFREGLTPMFRDFDGAWKNADGEARRTTRLLMQNVEREMNKTVMDVMDLGNPLARDGSTVNFMRKMANHFSNLTGITAWNSFWRQVAGRTVQARVLEDAVKGFDNLSPSEKAWLANNRVTPAKLDAIREAWEAQPVQRLPDGGVYPDLDRWPAEARETLQILASNEASNNIIAPQFVDKMAMSATPGGRLVGQFRSHMFANQVRLIGRNRQLAMLDNEKAGQVYTALGMLVGMGLVVDYVKHATGDITFDGTSKKGTGQSSHEKWMENFEANPFDTTFNALDRSGVFGVMMEADNIADKIFGSGIRATGRYLAGDENAIGSSRLKNRGVIDTLAGPSAGLIEDTAGAATAFKHLLQNGEISRNDWKTARRILPGQNAWIGIQQTLNEGEKQVGHIYDWQQ